MMRKCCHMSKKLYECIVFADPIFNTFCNEIETYTMLPY